MNMSQNGPARPCDGPKNTSQTENSTKISLQKSDLPTSLRQSKRLQKGNILENKSSDILPVNKGLPNKSDLENDRPSSENSCRKIFPGESSELGHCNQDTDFSHNTNHKFYGCRRKGYPSPCSESFGLPDDPIFSNSPIFLGRTTKCPLDVDLADPWDLCVLDLESIDQPWLVEYPEVITPYCDVESLFPFDVEDIRQKIEPEYDPSRQRNLSDSFNISGSTLDVSTDNKSESDNDFTLFTSTPIKNQNNSLSVMSLINITTGEDNNVNMAVLKDEVLKAVEEAIKMKTTIGNIDMKIQIVTANSKSPVAAPKKGAIEVTTNENTKTESCPPSRKENYFIKNVRNIKEKSKSICNAKELISPSNLNKGYNGPGSDVNDQSQDELNCVNKLVEGSSSPKKKKKLVKNKANTLPGLRRSLRCRESNIFTTSDKDVWSTSTSIQLPFEDSFLKHAPISTSKLLVKAEGKTQASKNQFEESQQPIELASVTNKEGQSDSRRILRSSLKEDVSESENTISKNDINDFVRKQKQKNMVSHVRQSKDSIGVANRSKRRSNPTYWDSQSSQDESDSSEPTGRPRSLRVRGLKNKVHQSSQYEVDVQKPKRSERLINVNLETKKNEVTINGTLSGQDEEKTSKPTSKKAGLECIQGEDRSKRRSKPTYWNSQSSQDESDSSEPTGRPRNLRVRGLKIKAHQSSQYEVDVKKPRGSERLINVNLETKENEVTINGTLSGQDEENTSKSTSKKPELECVQGDDRSKRRSKATYWDSQSSQDESDSSEPTKRPRSLRVRSLKNKAHQSSQYEVDVEKPKGSERFINVNLETKKDEVTINGTLSGQDEEETSKPTSKKTELEFIQGEDRSKRRSKPTYWDSQSSQDESDSSEPIGRKSLRVRGLINVDLETKEGRAKINCTLSEQDVDKTSKSTRKDRFGGNKLKKNKMPINKVSVFSQYEDTTSEKKEEAERSIRKLRSQNNFSRFSHNESDTGKNDLENSDQASLLLSEKESAIYKSLGKKLSGRELSLKEGLQSSQDESDNSRNDPDKMKKRKRGRPRKVNTQEKLDVLNTNHDCPLEKANKSIQNLLDSAEEELEDMSSTKRKLRSSTQHFSPTESVSKERRRRTYSSNPSEKDLQEQNNGFPVRKRSVSVNYGTKAGQGPPLRRSLRSQAAEPTKILDNIECPEYSFVKNYHKVCQNLKSPKISFNLSNSFKESPKRFNTDSPMKSILKNIYDSSGPLIGVKMHEEKHLKMMPNGLEIKTEDEATKDTLKMEELEHQVIFDPTKLELSVKKEEKESLRENGITSQIKIVISPLEIKEEVETGCRTVPIIPTMSESDTPPLEESASGIISNITSKEAKLDNNKFERTMKSDEKSCIPQDNICTVKSGKTSNISLGNLNESIVQGNIKSRRNNGKIQNEIIPLEAKEIKIEQPDYDLGNFVWAQVGKYPYWPAVVSNDPVTQTFRKEVNKQNWAPQVYYHIRFFGDYGRRAWVGRRHIMLYCSDQDLERIAKELKSENKSYNIVKPYLVSGTHVTEKWHSAVDELNLLKVKKYDFIIKHMLESYENHIRNRSLKRKLHILNASLKSELEESDTSERHVKKFKASEYHVTADAHIIDDNLKNKGSRAFDEVNNIIGTQNTAENSGASETLSKPANRKPRTTAKNPELLNSQLSDNVHPEKVFEAAESSEPSDKITPRRSRRSLKPVESFHITAETQLDENLNAPQEVKSVEVSEASESPSEASIKLNDRRSLRAPKSFSSNEPSSSQSIESEKVSNRPSKKQLDEGSEAESQSSSNLHMYSFEYQMDLHKKNSLFNGLRSVKVCDYCLKQGDLYKCKGRCGGFFHKECASKVNRPYIEKPGRKREKSPSKAKGRSAGPSVETTPNSDRIEEMCRTKDQSQVQIITIKSKHAIRTPTKVNLPANFDELSLSEQIDYGMKEMMKKFEDPAVLYVDSTDSSSEDGSIIVVKNKPVGILDVPASSLPVESRKSVALNKIANEEKTPDELDVSTATDDGEGSTLVKHVTADSVIFIENEGPVDITNLKCTYCRLELDPPCFACGLEVSKLGSSTRRKCSQHRCARYYHPHCLKLWPQTQWSIGKWSRHQEQEDSFTCPAHTCHTCFSEELGSNACRLPGEKVARCMLCPAGFHSTTFCIPAGTDILGGLQIVCPRHRPRPIQPINTIWCFICSEGGNLICCDTCPTSVHPECQPINLTDDDKYICEECESGRFPLYDEIVWVKLGQYRWWPAVVLFPNEIPKNVNSLKHQRGDFAVRFFGTNDHYWVNRSRSFLFEEGDRGSSPGEVNKFKNKVYESFGKAIEDAALAYKLKKDFKLRREAESINNLKPPPFVRINKNRPVGNVKSLELNLSNAAACECDPNKPHPCGPDDRCINRLLMTECDPDACPAGNRCRNQSFQKRDYPPMIPYKTQGRGWGLKCLAPIKKGQFVIEYVGDLIDSEEYQRRIQKMHEQKEENYYFMTVDSDRMIDAGPKGNISRFMNHCCNPNCVTQKWTVRGDTRVGLFAKCDIESGSELTFNYNLEVVGQEKKVCKCGASNCSGFIGVKAKSDKPEKPQTGAVSDPTERRSRKYNKKRAVSPILIPPCFMCGRKQSDFTCNNKFCNKGYHFKCLKLEEMPEVTKFTCPRHNCNLCSNRTIRCCVKCTNSFCPSHSEGNVRHDKFLGFVCRLHDPGLSSTEITSETVREQGKQTIQRSSFLSNNKTSTSKSINFHPPEKRDAVRAAWRLYKKREKERTNKTRTGYKRKRSFSVEKSKIGELRQKRKTSNSINSTLPQQYNRTENVSSGHSVKKYQLDVKKDTRRKLSVPKWREKNKLSRLMRKDKLRTERKPKVLNMMIDRQINIVANNQDNDVLSIQHTNTVKDHDTTNDTENVSTPTVPVQIESNGMAEPKDDEPKVQNNLVTSENPDVSKDISSVTSCVLSAFKPIKSSKRRRSKPDSTDESTVSSTTSDKDSNAKVTPLPKEPANIENNDLEGDDLVSSSPPKKPAEFSEYQEDVVTSEDELPLDIRIKRRSGFRNSSNCLAELEHTSKV